MRLPTTVRNFSKSFLSVAFILIFSRAGFSQLSFYNTSTEDVYIAVQYVDQSVWKTQGWYKVGPLQTEKVVPKITNRYYYFYAHSGDGKMVWSGNDTHGWVHKKNGFATLDGKVYSTAEGYEKKGLKKIDVRNALAFTYTLDFRTEFVIQLEKYFSKAGLDPVEGMYSVSDEITTETYAGAGQVITSNEKKDYWAKVAIVKDSLSVSRNYVEFVVEDEEFKEGAVRAEFLLTHSPVLFMTEQRTKPGDEKRAVVLELNRDTGIMEGKFEYTTPRKKYTVKRSYLRYFPK